MSGCTLQRFLACIVQDASLNYKRWGQCSLLHCSQAVLLYTASNLTDEFHNIAWVKVAQGCKPSKTDLVMLPDPVDHSPAMARRTEVLPTPLGPITSRDSPSLTWFSRVTQWFSRATQWLSRATRRFSRTIQGSAGL